MVNYSQRAARALAYLKRFYNDIDIYIEDVTCHNMALFVFKRILGDNVRLTSVNQLGGKEEVLKACRLDQQDDGRKKLYLIDGDLDLLTGVPKPRLKHLYRLRAYCFENVIIADRAVLEVASEASPNIPPHQLEQRLDHLNWITATAKSLSALFTLYGVARQLCPGVQTTAFNVMQLCVATPNGPVLSDPKIRSRMRSLLRVCRQHASLNAISATRREIQSRATRFKPGAVISGKDYLFPLLKARLRSMAGVMSGSDELKARLARRYDTGQEPYLARRLRQLLA